MYAIGSGPRCGTLRDQRNATPLNGQVVG